MINAFRRLIKSESQPILVKAGTGGGTQIFFPDNQYIRNKKLCALNLTADMSSFFGLAPTKYVDGKDLAGVPFLLNCYLTLESYSGVQFVRKKPLVEFMPYNAINGVGNIATQANFIGQRVNWPKCYIEIANGAAPPITDIYVLFDIFFTETNAADLQKQLGTEFKNKK